MHQNRVIPNSSRLISPSHLPAITPLEMTWDFTLWVADKDSRGISNLGKIP